MILGRGTAQTQEAIIAEYSQFLERLSPSHNQRCLQELRAVPAVLSHRKVPFPME
jgi:hypothetical protein